MKPALPSVITRERRRARRRAAARRGPLTHESPAETRPTAERQAFAAVPREEARAAQAISPISDPAASRVRAAGGPLDVASYACQCGYLFAAAVTTTVSCPHCGETQAW